MSWDTALCGAEMPVDVHVVWNRDLVQARLIEAAVIERDVRMPGGPRGHKAVWPPALMEMAEKIAGMDGASDGVSRRNLTAAEIGRWEQTLEWYGLFLAPYRYKHRAPDIPSAIFAYTKCVVRPNLSLSYFCRKKGWTRKTTYNRFVAAMDIIADGLNAMGVVVSEADPDIVAPYIADKRG